VKYGEEKEETAGSSSTYCSLASLYVNIFKSHPW